MSMNLLIKRGGAPERVLRVSCFRNEGITLATLKSHARKDHSIELNIKEKRAIRSSPLSCQYCAKSYARPQTLKNHIKKHHSNQTLGHTFPPFDNSIILPIDDQVTQALNAEIAMDPDLQIMIQDYPIHKIVPEEVYVKVNERL